MTLICLASQKGSPGVSAAALAVAASLRPGPGRRKLLLEADVSGGVLAIRYRQPTEPGLVTLAAAARAGLDDEELWRHTRELPGGLAAVVCPDGADRVQSALAAAGARLGRHLADRRDVDVICDLGRLAPGSPAMELAAESTALLMVARPQAEQLQPAAQRLQALKPEVDNLGWVLVGDRPHGPVDVETTFGFPVVGVLADDRRTVEAIEAGAVSRRVRRHPYVRSATSLADTLRTWLSPLTDAPPGPSPPADDSAGRSAVPAEPADGPDPVALGAPPAVRPGARPDPTMAPDAMAIADPLRPDDTSVHGATSGNGAISGNGRRTGAGNGRAGDASDGAAPSPFVHEDEVEEGLA